MKMILKGMGIMIASAIIASSCTKSNDDSTPENDVINKNVAYANVSALQNMDVYLPAARNTTDTKVIIFIHGGGWNAGDKTEFDEAITALWPSLKNSFKGITFICTLYNMGCIFLFIKY